MYTDDIAGARTQLQCFEEELGQGVLLAQLTQLETLWELTQQALMQVSSHVGSFIEFYDALAQLRHFLESARVNLRILEREADDLRTTGRRPRASDTGPWISDMIDRGSM